eukprot:3095349-Rhodomonas_salina.4
MALPSTSVTAHRTLASQCLKCFTSVDSAVSSEASETRAMEMTAAAAVSRTFGAESVRRSHVASTTARSPGDAT